MSSNPRGRARLAYRPQQVQQEAVFRLVCISDLNDYIKKLASHIISFLVPVLNSPSQFDQLIAAVFFLLEVENTCAFGKFTA